MTAPRPDAPPAIRTRGLNLWYGRFQALIRVDFDVGHGIVTALIGPSGCGKSTLLRTFNRQNERIGNVRTEGTVEVLGADIFAPEVDTLDLRRRVGMVFQRPNPLPISVRENVLFGWRTHHAERATREQIDALVEQALREVDLWDALKDRLGRRATELQLEHQQRLCIARLLPLKPDVILMDEPCSALDARATAQIEDLILSLRGRYTFVVVTHNMAQARRIGDRCAFMMLGEMVEHTRTEDMFINPRDERTAAYIEGRYG
jgi:phosphate transport system ATP-binding protein